MDAFDIIIRVFRFLFFLFVTFMVCVGLYVISLSVYALIVQIRCV